VGNQRYYVAMNNIDKLLFKKKLIYFLHFKHATEDLEEEEVSLFSKRVTYIHYRHHTQE